MALVDNPPLDELVAQAQRLLSEHYQCAPSHVAIAPGRVNLIGEHIDYCDGIVLPCAIERYVVIAATLHQSDHGKRPRARIRSAAYQDEQVQLALDSTSRPGEPHWANALSGVLQGFRNRGLVPASSFDAVILSSVPLGSGLSSSAALECAFATLLEALTQSELEAKAKALLCQQAEQEFLGTPCGIMDQFASVLAQANHFLAIDCQSYAHEQIPFFTDELCLLITNTKVQHSLADGQYAERKSDTEAALKLLKKSSWRDLSFSELAAQEAVLGPRLFRRARHVVSEIARTQAAISALKAHDYQRLGELMSASHHSLRDDFQVSCPELDTLVTIATEQLGHSQGVLGSRMTGGGFGGCTITLCKKDQAARIAETMSTCYQRSHAITPEIFCAQPSAGAQMLAC